MPSLSEYPACLSWIPARRKRSWAMTVAGCHPDGAGYAIVGVAFPLPLLPPTAMPGRTAAGSWRRPELRPRLARVGGLEDFAAAGVGRGLARPLAAGAVGQGFGAVHFVEMGFVDAGSIAGTTRGMPLTPTLSP